MPRIALVLPLVISMVIVGFWPAALAEYGKSPKQTAGKSQGSDDMIRVIAESDQEASAAVDRGCKIVRETKGLKAMLCRSETTSSLGLKEDLVVFKMDSGANSQIGVTGVYNSGNNGAGRKIVVLDTGYNYNHPDLSSSYLGGKDFVNNDNDPFDDNGHGSHVAGLITVDGLKFSAKGAAYKAGIISGKVLDSEGSGYFSDVIAAIYWAVDGPDGKSGTRDDFKADAINLSVGTSPPKVYKYHCNSVMPSLTSAVRYAVNKGVTVVAAAGNYGTSGVSMPGCISYSTTVGAVSSTDKVTSFSGRGRGVDISAPGTNLKSAWLGTSYVTASGTSMATPIVSATVALIKHEHPYFSSYKVQEALFNTSKDLGKVGRDWSYGYGRVDAAEAVAY